MPLQVRVHAPSDVRVDAVPEPDPGPDDVILRVAACGICGTDLGYIEMGGLRAPEPMCLGHEIAGTVDWVGDNVTSVEVGARVIVQPGTEEGGIGNGSDQGGLTPLLQVVDADNGRLHAAPENLPLDVAAFAEPLAVGMHAADQADCEPGEGICVFGCGPVGLAAIATLVDRGHEKVVAVDLSPKRLALARSIGAQAAIDPSADDPWGALTDLHGARPFMFGSTPATGAFIEASGAAAVIGDIIDHAAVGARISIVGLHHAPVPTNYLMVLMKELRIRGSIAYPPRFADAIELLERRDLSGLITHRIGIENFDHALDLLRGSKDCGKVLIVMGR